MSNRIKRILSVMLGVALVLTPLATTEASWLSRLIPSRYSVGPAVATMRIDGVDYRLTAGMIHQPAIRVLRIPGWSMDTIGAPPTTRVAAVISRTDGSTTLPSGVWIESIELMQNDRVMFQTSVRSGRLNAQVISLVPHGSYVGEGVQVPSNLTYGARVTIRTSKGPVHVLVAAPAQSGAIRSL